MPGGREARAPTPPCHNPRVMPRVSLVRVPRAKHTRATRTLSHARTHTLTRTAAHTRTAAVADIVRKPSVPGLRVASWANCVRTCSARTCAYMYTFARVRSHHTRAHPRTHKHTSGRSHAHGDRLRARFEHCTVRQKRGRTYVRVRAPLRACVCGSETDRRLSAAAFRFR